MYKKILFSVTAAALVAAVAVTQFVSAANLNQAASTLPENEEWSIMAHAAIGQNIGSGYLRGALNGGSATDYEKRILAITSVGQNPRTWGNENFVDSLLKKFDGNQMGDGGLLNDDIFGLLALKSAGESGDVTNKLRDHILANQNSDGGWSFSRGGSSDSNTTAMAISALRTVGSVPSSAANYLRATQNDDGGFGFTTNESSDGASTAWVILGLRASGSAVPSNTNSYMDSLQLSNGAFRWKLGDANGSSLVTAYSVLALSGETLPIRTVANNPTPTPQPNPAPAQTPNPIPAPTQNPNPSPTPTPVVTPNMVNNAECISISAPDRVQTNQTFFTSVNVKNTGTTTWASDNTPHRLGAQNPQDNHVWGSSRMTLPVSSVSPNQTITFTYTAKAPATPGNYSFSWRAMEEDVVWFGNTCSKTISVSAPVTTPTPTPTPAPTPTPIPAPTFTPPPPAPIHTPTVLGTHSGFDVTITYPGNKIYVDRINFSSTNFSASNGQNYSYSNPRAIGTLIQAANSINLLYEIKGTSFGPFVHAINGYPPVGANGWMYAVNGSKPNVAASDYILQPGDKIQWFYGVPDAQPF